MKIKHYLALPMALLLMGSLFTGCGSKRRQLHERFCQQLCRRRQQPG